MKLVDIYRRVLSESVNLGTFVTKFKEHPSLMEELMSEVQKLRDQVESDTRELATLFTTATNPEDDKKYGDLYDVGRKYMRFLDNILEMKAHSIDRTEFDEILKKFTAGMNIGRYDYGEQIGTSSKLGKIYTAVGDATLFRSVTLEDLKRIRSRGYIDTDCRGCIVPDEEGINLATDPSTSFYYIPNGKAGVVLAIDPTGLDLFLISADSYIRTKDRIPLGNVIRQSIPIEAGKVGGYYYYHPDEAARLGKTYLKFKDDPTKKSFIDLIDRIVLNQ